MIVFEKARELGQLILMTEEAIKREEAMDAYMNDDEAIAAMKEYESFQREMQVKLQNNELNKAELSEASDKLRKMGTELKAHPVTGPYIEALNNFNKMVNQVFGIIQKTALGGDLNSDGCGCSSGGCDSCSDGDCLENSEFCECEDN